MQYEAHEAFVEKVESVREKRRAGYVLVRMLGVCLTVGLVGVRPCLDSFSWISIDEELLTAE